MARARELHREAMNALSRAELARLENKPKSYKRYLKRSLELEEEAALQLISRTDLEPTRSQLYKGAALLALRLNEWRRAERLVAFALSGNPPEHNAEELRNILENVHFSRHILRESMILSEDELDLTVTGDSVGYGIADKDEVFRRIEVLQTMFIRSAERRRDIPFRTRGRPSAEVSREVQLYLATPRAASFGMRIRLGSDQGRLPGMSETAFLIESTLLALDAYNGSREEELARVIPQEPYRRNFVSQARELLPDGRKVKTVHLISENQPNRKVISLTRRKRHVTDEQEDKRSEGGPSDPIVYLVGEIRAMDSRAEDEYIAVVSGDTTEKVYVPSEAMDTLTTYYKAEARVTAYKRGKRLIFVDIERVHTGEENA